MSELTKLRRWAPILMLIGAGLVAYHNSLNIPFVLDDMHSIVNNPHIRTLWPLSEMLAGTSRPLVQLSLAVNYAVGGFAVTGYHIFNITIHILSAVTLFCFLRRLLALINDSAGRLALAIALIWEVHPLVTQPVNYIIQRGELLMSLFYLLTLYCVVRTGEAERSHRWAVLAVLACALGMLSKPIIATAPLLALLLDVTFISRSWRTTLWARWGLYLGLAATWLIMPVALANGPADWKGSAGIGQTTMTPMHYALTQAGVLTHYLSLAVWPVGLCFDYRWPVITDSLVVAPALGLIGSGLGLTIWALVRKPMVGFWGAWFFIILIPTSSFIPVQDVAVEHRMYLALVALVTLAVLGLAWLSHRMQNRPKTGSLAVAVVVVGLIILTIRRNADYRTSETLWRDTVTKSPRNARALTNLGNAVSDDPARTVEAIAFYREAIRIEPTYELAHYNWGRALTSRGDYQAAQQHYELAIKLNPADVGARYNLGLALARQGQFTEALQQFEAVMKLQPANVEAQYNIGVSLEKQGQLEPSITAYQAALALDPTYAKAHYFLALVLAKAGRASEAREHFAIAVDLAPVFASRRTDFETALHQIAP